MEKIIKIGNLNWREINLKFQIKEKSNSQKTIDLTPAPNPAPILSLTGEIKNLAYGQINKTIKELLEHNQITLSENITEEKLLKILEIWDKWHLNDMRAGCRHQIEMGWRSCPGHFDNTGQETCRAQNPAKEATEEDIKKATENLRRDGIAIVGAHRKHYYCEEDKVGQPCPVCGYKYGTSWLYEPLPEEVIEFVNNL